MDRIDGIGFAAQKLILLIMSKKVEYKLSLKLYTVPVEEIAADSAGIQANKFVKDVMVI
jgi:hypothetical protein